MPSQEALRSSIPPDYREKKALFRAIIKAPVEKSPIVQDPENPGWWKACAWCHPEKIGSTPEQPNQGNITHGVCSPHKRKFLAQVELLRLTERTLRITH